MLAKLENNVIIIFSSSTVYQNDQIQNAVEYLCSMFRNLTKIEYNECWFWPELITNQYLTYEFTVSINSNSFYYDQTTSIKLSNIEIVYYDAK